MHHPVLDDPELTTWQQYAVRAWPTLVLVDPEGYVVAQLAGEGHAHALDALRRRAGRASTRPRARCTAATGRTSRRRRRRPSCGSRQGRSRCPAGTLLVADAGPPQRWSSWPPTARRCCAGSAPASAGSSTAPPGTRAVQRAAGPAACCRPSVRADGRVRRRGRRHRQPRAARRTPRRRRGHARSPAPAGSGCRATAATDATLSSPWDVAWWRRPGRGRDGRHPPAVDASTRRTGAVEVLAGTTNEGLLDGPLADAWFAQTVRPGRRRRPALARRHRDLGAAATSSDGAVAHRRSAPGLFDFGHVDGPAAQALLQHPLGVTVLPDGSVAVSDTYNGAVRRYDPATGEVSTLATGLAEPSGAVVVDGDLVVVESAAHRLTRVRLPDEALRGRRRRAPHPAAGHRGRAGRGRARGRLHAAAGPEARRPLRPGHPAGRLRDPAGAAPRGRGPRAPTSPGGWCSTPHVGDGVLHVAAMAASCDDDGRRSSSRPATCTSRTGACRSGSSTAPRRS